jgi:hypothetical protein
MNEGRDIEIYSAVETTGYGYVMYATPEDWAEIAASLGVLAGDNVPDAYIVETVESFRDCDPKVGIHFDSAQLVGIWMAIERLDFDPNS